MIQSCHFFQFRSLGIEFALVIGDLSCDFFVGSNQRKSQFLIAVMDCENFVASIGFLGKFDFCVLRGDFTPMGCQGIVDLLPCTTLIQIMNI